MKKLLLFILPVVLLTGCGVNTTPYLNDPVTTRVNLERANYRIVKQVSGYSSASYVLGIGGLSQRALQGNALDDMYANAKLTGNQQIINITTTQSMKLIIIYGKREVWAHGTVIEFIEDEKPAPAPVMVSAPVPVMVEEPAQPAAPKAQAAQAAQPVKKAAVSEADKFYIAYLMKTGHVNNDYRDELKAQFDMDQIMKYVQRYTTSDLNKLGKDHNKALNKYYK